MRAVVVVSILSVASIASADKGSLVVECDAPHGDVHVDEKPMVACPATQTLTLDEGQHIIELGTILEAVMVPANGISSATVHGGSETRRFPRWLPWTVIGGGVALGVAGLLLEMRASSQMDTYDANVAAQCAEHGCTGPEAALLEDMRNDALFTNKLGIGVGVAGLAALVGGLVMIALDDVTVTAPRIEIHAAPGQSTAIRTTWRF